MSSAGLTHRLAGLGAPSHHQAGLGTPAEFVAGSRLSPWALCLSGGQKHTRVDTALSLWASTGAQDVFAG